MQSDHRLAGRRVVARSRVLMEAVEGRQHCDADNNISGAVSLGTVATYVPKSGSLNHSTDATDFYKFTVPSNTKTFKVGISGLTSNADLYLYNSSKSVINSSKTTGSTDTITKTGLAAGTYYAEVRSVTGNTSYKLKLESDFTGDSTGSARSVGKLDLNTKTYSEYVGTLDSYDYYKFTTANQGNVTLKIDGLSDDADLQLLKSDGTAILSSSYSGTAADSITQSLSAGTYFAKVLAGTSTADAKYTLTLTGPPADTEPGGTPATAKNIGTVGSTQNTSTGTVTLDDTDVFKFTTSSNGVVDVRLTGLSGDADFQLLDKNGAQVAESHRTGTASEAVIWGGLPGAYYVRVTTVSKTPVNYSMTVANLPVPTDGGGNSLATATPIGGGSSSELQVFDSVINRFDAQDYYKLNITEPGPINAFIGNLSADLDMQILDASGNVLAKGISASASNEVVSYQPSTAGTYYVRVYQGWGEVDNGAASNYKLEIHAPTDTAGNTRATAKTVTSPFAASGQIGGYDGYDFYKVNVPSSSYLVMNLSTSDNPATLALYDANGGIVDFRSAKAGTPASLSYFMHTGGTYYVAAMSSSNLLSHYSISIKTQSF